MTERSTGYKCDVCDSVFERYSATCPECGLGKLKGVRV